MTSPLEQAGAVREPSQYAALSMDRGITGLWTQRSPLRDADVPYLYGKFYSASRFDSLIDGLNREITAKLTYARRAGCSVYNSNSFPAANSMYGWKRINQGVENIRILYDGVDGNIYDATAGGKTTIFTKGAGAGKARFAGVNTALYFADGVENKKFLQPDPWSAQTSLTTSQFAVGTIILDSNGNLQYLSSVNVGTVVNVTGASNAVIIRFSGTGFSITPGMQFIIFGLTSATYLNGEILIASSVTPNGSNFDVSAPFPIIPYASAPDTGTASTPDIGTPATTGGSAPTWNVTLYGTTADGISTWTNYGSPLYDWGPPTAPLQAPLVQGIPVDPLYDTVSLNIWRPNTVLGNSHAPMVAIVDANGYIHATSATTSRTGPTYPNLNPPSVWAPPAGQNNVPDGGITWTACYWFGSLIGATVGTLQEVILAPGPAAWAPLTAPFGGGAPGGDVCVDSNGNLQMVTGSTGTGKSGSSAPTWNVNYGGTTSDGGLTWTNLGPFGPLAYKGDMYGYAYHCIDGSVSTLSPLSPSTYGSPNIAQVFGFGSTNPTCDAVWIFRTSDGQSTPLFLAAIPNPRGNSFTFFDYFPDTDLTAEIAGPENEANNPPPVGMTAPLYHLGRMWAIYKNGVICSGGPDTLVGNGNTSFPPANFFPIPEQPVRLFPTLTQTGPGLLIWGTANIYVILGAGTPNSPFQQASLYMAGCGILSYDAVQQIGSTFYAFGNTAKVGANIVGKAYSLDPSAGYIEFGFPIGDQFVTVSTGGGGKIPSGVATGYLYNPASSFVTWAELSSGDTALYVSDGTYGWFRYSPVASPESGFLWSPRAVIVGGTSAVQGIEVQSGITQLLIAPGAGGGPILFRDSTTNADNGTAFPSYDVKGCIQLCLTGEIAEIAHVHLVSMPVGKRPVIGILPDEILASSAAPFTWLDRTGPEPPDLKPLQSLSVYSDRYVVMQSGTTGKCMFFQLGMDYGIQNVPDETLLFSIYGAKYAERKQQ